MHPTLYPHNPLRANNTLYPHNAHRTTGRGHLRTHMPHRSYQITYHTHNHQFQWFIEHTQPNHKITQNSSTINHKASKCNTTLFQSISTFTRHNTLNHKILQHFHKTHTHNQNHKIYKTHPTSINLNISRYMAIYKHFTQISSHREIYTHLKSKSKHDDSR